MTGPQHPPYGAFVPAPGHQIGFQEMKAVEAAAFLRAASGGAVVGPDVRAALDVERMIHVFAGGAQR